MKLPWRLSQPLFSKGSLTNFCQALKLLIETLENFKVTTTLRLLLFLFFFLGRSSKRKNNKPASFSFIHVPIQTPFTERKLLWPPSYLMQEQSYLVLSVITSAIFKKMITSYILPVIVLCIRNIFRNTFTRIKNQSVITIFKTNLLKKISLWFAIEFSGLGVFLFWLICCTTHVAVCCLHEIPRLF